MEKNYFLHLNITFSYRKCYTIFSCAAKWQFVMINQLPLHYITHIAEGKKFLIRVQFYKRLQSIIIDNVI